MKPFFSVIVPTYNRAERLVYALKSVLSQTYTHFEVIVVDDGSTDNTELLVANISDQRVRYFKKKNEERSIARNFGIAQAKGSYINFLDSDDFQLPNHLNLASSLIAENDQPDIIHLGYQHVDQNGNILLKRDNLSAQNLLKKMVHENILHGNAMFLKRNIALKHPFINSPLAFLSEDWYVWMTLLVRYNILFDNTITSVIVEHEQRSLKVIDPEKLEGCTQLIVKYLKKDKKFTDILDYRSNVFFSNQYTFLTLILALAGDKKNETWKYLFKALQQDVTVIGRKRFLASFKHLIKSYFSEINGK